MSICPTPGKRCYGSAAEALQGARGNTLMRPYGCKCGAWHLATRDGKPGKKKPWKGYRVYYRSTTKWKA